MATRFEIVLHGPNAAALRAAGEEALDEIDRLEAQLSLYRPSSEVARLNSLAARQPVRVSPELFRLLEHAAQLHRANGGAFDITIAPLVRCWGFMHGMGNVPDAAGLALARSVIGMEHVILDEKSFSVRFDVDGVMLDLGAIGKGYAIDCAVRGLRDAGVTSALIHGGTSTTFAIGHPPGADAWKIAIAAPPFPSAGAVPPAPLPTMLLRDESLSVSAGCGKSFASGGRNYGHVLDPRNGQPASETLLAAVVLPSATDTDALSTALLVLGAQGQKTIAAARPGIRTLLITNEFKLLPHPAS